MREVADYIAQDNPQAAKKWASGLFQHAKHLLKMPLAGRIVPEVGKDDLRELICGNYRVIYRIEVERIIILTVLHCRQLINSDVIETEE